MVYTFSIRVHGWWAITEGVQLPFYSHTSTRDVSAGVVVAHEKVVLRCCKK